MNTWPRRLLEAGGTRRDALFVVAASTGVIGLAVLLGILSHDFLTGVFVVAGITCVWVGCAFAVTRSFGIGWFLIAVGLFLTTGGMTRGQMGGHWLWLVPWMLEGAVITGMGVTARFDTPRTGESLMALGILVMVFAVFAPLFIYPALAGEEVGTGGASAAFSGTDAARAVGRTLRAAFTSVWGWIELAFLVVIGMASWWRRGAWLVPVLVVAAVFVIAGLSVTAGDAIASAAGLSPAAWLKGLVLAADEHWGSAGWGILVLAAGIVAASLPVVRKLLVMGQVGVAARRAEGSDSEAAARFMTAEGYGLGKSSLVVLAFEVLYVGTVAMLWAGLRWAADEGGALPFDALSLPDLTVPDFRPVWEVPYFMLALVVGLSAVLTGRILTRLNVTQRVPIFTSPVWQIGIAALGAFVAPAGVFLFGLGVAWMQTLAAIPLARPTRLLHGGSYVGPAGGVLGTQGVGTASAEAGPILTAGGGGAVAAGTGAEGEGTSPQGTLPGGSTAGGAVGGGFDDKPVWERDGAAELPIWGESGVTGGDAEDAGTPRGDKTAAEPIPSAAAVAVLFDAGPLIDIACIGDEEYVVLGAAGDITLFRGGTAGRSKRVPVIRPLGLGPAAARHVAFVDGGGRILELSFDEGDFLDQPGQDPVPVVHSGVTEEADRFAVSPLGTLVVTASVNRSRVSGFFLTSEIGRSLFDGIEPTTALGFSPDGRLVAVGTPSGDVHLVDVSGQGVTSVLSGEQAGGRAVVAVAGAPGNGWLVAYDDERVALWSGGEKLRSVDTGGGVTCLAVEATDGRVAAGTSFGLVRVSDADLEKRLAEARPFVSEVRRVLWVGGGAAIVCAGANGEVRRTELA